MSSNRVRLIHAGLIVAGALVAAGCNTTQRHIGEEDPYLGEAVKYDMAIQTINPDPVYPPTAAKPGDNGDKGAHAVRRYRTDAVKEVQASQTTAGTGSSR